MFCSSTEKVWGMENENIYKGKAINERKKERNYFRVVSLNKSSVSVV